MFSLLVKILHDALSACAWQTRIALLVKAEATLLQPVNF
jgi:hypothetical protein